MTSTAASRSSPARSDSDVADGFDPRNRCSWLGVATLGRVMGFNPYRRFRARPADIAMVVACIVIAIALVVWGFFG